MKINELLYSITESESVRELVGLRICDVILDDLEPNAFLDGMQKQIYERINELLESEL